MDLQLRDEVVLVTGGASGIGAAISLALAAEGAIPVVLGKSRHGRRICQCPAARSQPRALFHRIELSDEAACRDAVADTVARLGGIDGPGQQRRHQRQHRAGRRTRCLYGLGWSAT
jgi:L-fucose dehydrogenase